MSKKLNLLVIGLFITSSFFLISTNVNADDDCDYPVMHANMMESYECEKESNCCEARDIKCDYTREGELGQIAEYACVWGDGDADDWGDDDDAGCDDDTCENKVCQILPSCCMSAEPYLPEMMKYGEMEPAGWGEDCAILANEFCEVCDGAPFEKVDPDSDGDPFQLYAFFDLRDRESIVQVTNITGVNTVVHVQVFDVSNLCNENNFFDAYTGNDTHVYNMRDLTTNDGNPAGFELPDNAYGMVIVTEVTGVSGVSDDTRNSIVGNFRVLDNAGYEYRTNMLGIRSLIRSETLPFQDYYFNYNIKGNVTLSDVVGISILQNEDQGEVIVNAAQTAANFDIDIYNLNETVFSCRDIVFSCTANTFEYGINDAIPHSRGKDVLCPSNVVPEGIVVLQPEFFQESFTDYDNFVGYVGLNNGNGRGTMDSFWWDSFFTAAIKALENQQMN